MDGLENLKKLPINVGGDVQGLQLPCLDGWGFKIFEAVELGSCLVVRWRLKTNPPECL